MLLADRGYDAGWIRSLVNEQGAWANIPPKRNRRDPICFSPHLYRARNRIERFFMGMNADVLSGLARSSKVGVMRTFTPLS